MCGVAVVCPGHHTAAVVWYDVRRSCGEVHAVSHPVLRGALRGRQGNLWPKDQWRELDEVSADVEGDVQRPQQQAGCVLSLRGRVQSIHGADEAQRWRYSEVNAANDNKWTKDVDSRPHRMSCMPLLRIEWSLLLHTLQHRLSMLLTGPKNLQKLPLPVGDHYSSDTWFLWPPRVSCQLTCLSTVVNSVLCTYLMNVDF